VSPDQKQVIWIAERGGEILYYHVDDGFVRPVGKGWPADGEGLLWFTDEALQPGTEPQTLPEGWYPFEHAPYPEKRPPDTRKPITDYLAFTAVCDKRLYKQHEPVKITLAISNKGDVPLKVARLWPNWKICRVMMHDPVRGLMDRTWEGDEPAEYVSLKPGERRTAEVTLETTQPGTYRVEAELNTHGALKTKLDLKGGLRTASVEFTVEKSDDETALLHAKIRRLLDRLCSQQAKASHWYLCLPASDDLTDMGAPVVPFLLAALEAESNPSVTRRLVRTLNDLADPAALSLYQEKLKSDDAELRKLAVAGLSTLCKTIAADEALGSLLEILRDEAPDDLKTETSRYLARLRDERVREVFEEAVLRGDGAALPVVGRYLAAWEDMDLAEWLASVAKEPTHARFVSAQLILADLKKTWHADEMPDLAGLTWQRVSEDGASRNAFRDALQAWERWARENPRASKTYFERDRRGWQ